MDRLMRSCRAILIRYRVVFIIVLLLCIIGYRRSQEYISTTVTMDDMNSPPADRLRQQILNEIDAGNRKLDKSIEIEANMELVVQDTTGLNEEMNRDVRYLINSPNICNSSKFEESDKTKRIFLLIYIVTSSDQFVQRTRIRNTWGKLTDYSNMIIRSVFIINDLLNIKNKNGAFIRDAVIFEASTYGDMIQEDCTDCRKQTKRGGPVEVLRSWADLLALRWISEYCSGASFVIRADDDVFVNVYTLVNHLTRLYTANITKRLIMCDVVEKKEITKEKKLLNSKPGKTSPVIQHQYCSKVSHILSRDVVDALLEAAYHASEPNRITDEYYITNLLPSLLGPEPLTLTSMSSAYCMSSEMSAYIHETEWYKYAFTRIDVKASINALRIWTGLTVRAKTRKIPESTRLIPGILADDYIPRQRLLMFRID